MTKVNIDVDTAGLGDITITREDRTKGYLESEARSAVAEQLAQAVAQLCYAFEIEPIAVTSRIDEIERMRHASWPPPDAASG